MRNHYLQVIGAFSIVFRWFLPENREISHKIDKKSKFEAFFNIFRGNLHFIKKI